MAADEEHHGAIGRRVFDPDGPVERRARLAIGREALDTRTSEILALAAGIDRWASPLGGMRIGVSPASLNT
jgi:hypothetical protein